ncbi:hypothetical protein RRG08_052228 [Elysia crispata]|uniref:Uncharacterized protein n=1 Tax=Elysia crispata TaxID=231223 RepID=A0AAE0ZZ59_9GAST|nr:hypothetical protein RRG08_052228 [Elysia crispata]
MSISGTLVTLTSDPHKKGSSEVDNFQADRREKEGRDNLLLTRRAMSKSWQGMGGGVRQPSSNAESNEHDCDLRSNSVSYRRDRLYFGSRKANAKKTTKPKIFHPIDSTKRRQRGQDAAPTTWVWDGKKETIQNAEYVTTNGRVSKPNSHKVIQKSDIPLLRGHRAVPSFRLGGLFIIRLGLP